MEEKCFSSETEYEIECAEEKYFSSALFQVALSISCCGKRDQRMGQANSFSVSIECDGMSYVDGSSLSIPYGREYAIKMHNKSTSQCDATLTLDNKTIGTWIIPSKQYARVESEGSETYLPLVADIGVHKIEVLFQPREKRIENDVTISDTKRYQLNLHIV